MQCLWEADAKCYGVEECCTKLNCILNGSISKGNVKLFGTDIIELHVKRPLKKLSKMVTVPISSENVRPLNTPREI